MGITMRSESALLMLTLMAVSRFSAAVGMVHKVGDGANWNVGAVDYREWAYTKVFHVGDIINFEYNPLAHNVLRVSQDDYRSCNTAAPIATYTTGNDSITIVGPGHYYYICGFEGHCRAGQKVDIRVLKVSQPTELPNGTPAQSPVRQTAPAPAPESFYVASPPRPSGGLSLITHFRRHGLRDLALAIGISSFMI